MATILLSALAVIFVYMLLFFLVAQFLGDNSIVDIGWGFGFVAVALFSFFLFGRWMPSQILITVLTAIWGIRLTVYIFLRNRGKGEDFRYKKWREEWGRWVMVRAFFQVFMLQGFFMWVISLPVLIVNGFGLQPFGIASFLGLVVWLVGFYFEAVGDRQMKQFKADPENKGKVMDRGLWKYTRHPNYFGEVTMWWGIWIISLPAGLFWLTLISPLVITWLILKVSGIPMLEAKYKEDPKYQDYIRKTSVFFPFPPKKEE